MAQADAPRTPGGPGAASDPAAAASDPMREASDGKPAPFTVRLTNFEGPFDLLLQLIEASISLVTGSDGYSDCNSFYTEQLANPSLSSPHLLTARGVTRILQGEIAAAKSDLEEVQTKDAETLAALVVAAGLSREKGSEAEAEQLWRCVIG